MATMLVACSLGNSEESLKTQVCNKNKADLIFVDTAHIRDTSIYYEFQNKSEIIQLLEIYNCSDTNVYLQINESEFLCVGKKIEYFKDETPAAVSYSDYSSELFVEIKANTSKSFMFPFRVNLKRIDMTFKYKSDYYPDSTLFYTAKFEFD